MLPAGDSATLIALDGATVSSVFRQIERIPSDATHLVLSAGGNDALWMAGNIFSPETPDVRTSLRRIAELLTDFKIEYRRLICHLRALRLPLVTCTIYDSVPGLDASEIAGLCVFNDTITRTAFEFGTTLIDLRTICNESSDYAPVSRIEPSASVGGKYTMESVSRSKHDLISGVEAVPLGCIRSHQKAAGRFSLASSRSISLLGAHFGNVARYS